MKPQDHTISNGHELREEICGYANDKKTQSNIIVFPESSEDDIDHTATLEKWNSPRINAYRYCSANLALFIQDMHDACIGALVPYMETYYDINYTTVSTVFVVPFAGCLIAAMSNSRIHYSMGQRGIAFLGPVCRLIGYISLVFHPPFPVIPCAMLITTVGNTLEDSAYNAWIGNMQHANELLGILQAIYAIGATISPLIASAMITKANLEWYFFFYIMIGLSFAEFVIGLIAFWNANGEAYRARLNGPGTRKERVTTRAVLKGPITWLLAIFLLGYTGVEVSLGGWIVTFMIRVRNAEKFLAGLTVTLFWLGIGLGRIVLGFVTGRLGEKLAIVIYLACAVISDILYWQAPNFAAAVVFVILLGFFLGPLFPGVIVVATKLLPVEQHVSAIGFAAAFGGGDAAVLPFIVGVIAENKGVGVLHPFSLAFFVFIAMIWVLLPGGFKKGGLEEAWKWKEKPGVNINIRSWMSRKGSETTHEPNEARQ